MTAVTFLFSTVIILIFCFALTSGLLNGGGIVSTVIMTRVLEPLPALLIVASFQMIGLFVLGSAVAMALGSRMITFPLPASPLPMLIVLCGAITAAFGWNTAMWRFSFPSSSSHSLLGGLLGATWAGFGSAGIHWTVVYRMLLALALVPLATAALSFLLARALYWIGQFLTPAVGGVLRGAHITMLAGLALVQGNNDGQKSVALMLLALLAMGVALPAHGMPAWILLVCGFALSAGMLFGSRRIVQAVGARLYRVQSLQGLCAESATMLMVGASSVAGLPMSSSHVMSSSVLGAGAAVHPRGVRWGIVEDILLAWFFTIPAAGLVAAALVAIGRTVFHVVP